MTLYMAKQKLSNLIKSHKKANVWEISYQFNINSEIFRTGKVHASGYTSNSNLSRGTPKNLLHHLPP